MSADLEVEAVEHAWSWEARTVVERQPLGPVEHVVHRLVCSCTYATFWRRDAYLATSQAVREHGVDRQLGLL